MDAQIRDEHERIEQLLLEAENEDEEPIPDNPEFWAAMRQDLDEYIKREGLE